MQQAELLKRIMLVPGLMGGKPTIRGMRFRVTDVLEMLASGMSREEILNDFPDLETEDIQVSLLYASVRLNGTVIIQANAD